MIYKPQNIPRKSRIYDLLWTIDQLRATNSLQVFLYCVASISVEKYKVVDEEK